MARFYFLMFVVFGGAAILGLTQTSALTFLVAEQPALMVESERDLGEIPAGLHKIELELFNASYTRDRTFLNVYPRCGETACIGLAQQSKVQLTIPPRSKITLELQLRAPLPGPFHVSLPIFVDDCGTRTISFTVSGTAIAPGK